jgi:hypothetical protein
MPVINRIADFHAEMTQCDAESTPIPKRFSKNIRQADWWPNFSNRLGSQSIVALHQLMLTWMRSPKSPRVNELMPT